MAVLNKAGVVAALLIAAGLGTACLSPTPQERDPAIQGGDDDEGDPEHRPGQPCLLCHGPGHLVRPGGVGLEIAGTVYGAVDAAARAGLSGVEVRITDADGFEFAAITNRTGNFMFEVDTGATAVRARKNGRVTLPRAPTYPLEVVISRATDTQQMRTKIWRDGGCAHCHQARPGTDSVGRVSLFAPVVP